jgi:hypothetical protein
MHVDEGASAPDQHVRRLRRVLAINMPSSLDTEALRTLLIGGVGLFIVMGILSAWVLKTAVMKLISISVCLGLALFAWSQRANAADCARKVTTVQPGATEVRCSVAGFDVNISPETLPNELRGQLLQNARDKLGG